MLTVSRSAFYAWQRAELSLHEQRDEELLPLIRIIFRKHKRRYGARRIADELRDTDQACSVLRVRKLLKTQGLKAIQPKSFHPRTTNSRHRLGYSPNLLLDAVEPDGVNQLWVGDITYIRLRGRTFCYLAVLMDRFSRRIIGSNMTESLVLKVLRRAIQERHLTDRLIHHTDCGGQYAGTKSSMQERSIATFCVEQTFVKVGKCGCRACEDQVPHAAAEDSDCYDNAFMESCFGTLKRELEMTEYNSHREAHAEIAQYIRYDNFERKHSGIEYLKPAQFEALINQPE